MKKSELSKALEIAKSDIKLDEQNASLVPFDGFGLKDFEPVYVTLNQIARLIRWQCICLDGSIDNDNFQDIAYAGKRKFMVI
ncbi:MAG: hypothetical protein WC119_00645 [Synergistaceae bacterium]